MLSSSGNVTLKPLSGQLTHDTDTWSKMDPYVKVTIGSQTEKTKTCSGGGKFPSWTCSLSFRRSTEDLINFEVWDKDTFKDDLIGQGALAFSTVFASGNKYNGWVDLTYKGKGAGKLLVEIQFFPDKSQQLPTYGVGMQPTSFTPTYQPTTTMPMQTYPTQTYPTQTYPTTTFPTQTYPTTTFPTQTFPTQTFPTPTYPTQTYTTQTFPTTTQSFPTQSFPTQSFPTQSFPTQSFPTQSYPTQTFTPQTYPTQTFTTTTTQTFPTQGYPTQQQQFTTQQQYPTQNYPGYYPQ